MNSESMQLLQLLIPLLTPVATLAIIMVLFLSNNSRLNDLRDLMRAENKIGFDRINQKIDSLLKMMADIDLRVTRLDERKS